MGKRKRKEDTKSNPVEDGPNPAGDHIPTASDNNSEEPKTHLQTLIEVKDDFDKLKELWRARVLISFDQTLVYVYLFSFTILALLFFFLPEN